jgi:S1-C subfamily serine protease
MNTYRKFAVSAMLILFSVGIGTGGYSQIAADRARENDPKFRVARSICGSRGSQDRGRFVIEDPRSVFSIPQDRQVIVYLELEGPTGMHRIEGFWKNPSGKVATISDFNYESLERRFSAHFTLALSESAETGTWALEVHVDGEYIGAFTFQIVTNSPPAEAASKRKLLSPPEIYQRALASTVMIEKLGKGDELLGIRSGFIVTPTAMLSTFRTVDGASKIRVSFPDGRRQETDQMLAWNRQQDWVTIKIDPGQTPALPWAQANSWNVGDSVTYLEVSPEGNRVLSEVKIVGKNTFPSAGDRLNLSHPASAKALGAPLLNEYGEVVGMLGGSLYSGRDPENPLDMLSPDVFQSGNMPGSAIAIPVTIVNLKRENPAAMETLIRNGESFPPVTAREYVSYVQLAHGLDRSGGSPWPIDSSTEFLRRDGKVFVFVVWDSKEEIKGRTNLQVYSGDNKLLIFSGKVKDTKVNLKPGRRISTYWQVDISNMAPGVYRVDVLLNEEPACRTFFRITG